MAHFVECIGHMYLHSLDLSYNQISPGMEKIFSQTAKRLLNKRALRRSCCTHGERC
jgi:hypothetical protein